MVLVAICKPAANGTEMLTKVLTMPFFFFLFFFFQKTIAAEIRDDSLHQYRYQCETIFVGK